MDSFCVGDRYEGYQMGDVRASHFLEELTLGSRLSLDTPDAALPLIHLEAEPPKEHSNAEHWNKGITKE